MNEWAQKVFLGAEVLPEDTKYGDFLVFGSKNSVDFDVIVLVPLKYLQNSSPHILVKENLVVNSILAGVVLKGKAVNTCFGFWQNGRIVACQKGSIEETNNSILKTFELHLEWQTLKRCPIFVHLERTKESKQAKMFGVIRMVTSCLSHAHFGTDESAEEIRRILMNVLNFPQFSALSEQEWDLFCVLVLKICDLKKSVLNE